MEKNILPEFKVYERGFATTDVLIRRIYGIAALGLILNASLVFKLV